MIVVATKNLADVLSLEKERSDVRLLEAVVDRSDSALSSDDSAGACGNLSLPTAEILVEAIDKHSKVVETELQPCWMLMPVITIFELSR